MLAKYCNIHREVFQAVFQRRTSYSVEKSSGVTIFKKINEKYFPVLLLIMTSDKTGSNFSSPWVQSQSEHLSERCWALLSCGTVYIMLYWGIRTFESVDKILKCDHSKLSNKS